MYRTGARTKSEMRFATVVVRLWCSHAFWEHQHWKLVRTGESWSPARLRSKWPSHVLMNASASSSLTKLLSDTTHGALAPFGPPGQLRAFGEYCGNSLMMRWNVSFIVPGPRAGGVAGGRSHIVRLRSQMPQDDAQL